MTILLLRPYSTHAQGATVDLDNATEAALVAQGRATYTVNPGSSFTPLTPAEQQTLRGVLAEIADGNEDGSVSITSIGRSGAVWGNGSYVMGTATIPAGTVKAGGMLRLRGLLSKLSPFNGGSSISVALKQDSNTVTIGQTSLNATMANYPFAQDLQLSNDRKWAFTSGTNSVNFYGQAATAAGVYSLQTVVADGGPSTAYPRTQSTIAFTSYTSAPVVETVLIDFDRDVTLSVTVGIVTGDCVELLYCSLEAVSSLANGLTTGLSPTIFLGDSLTEGTGATTGNELPNLVGKARPGRGVFNFGMGGQTISTIVDRALTDPVAGKYWDMVLWAGVNDVTANATTWFNTIKNQITRLRAFRAPNARMMILNFHPKTDWSAELKAAEVSVNAMLLAEYGSLVVDVYTAVGTTGGAVPGANLADTQHLNDTGYGLVKDAIIAKMTALGWP
mgnify:FL=1